MFQLMTVWKVLVEYHQIETRALITQRGHHLVRRAKPGADLVRHAVKRGVVVAITYKTNIRKASHPYVTVKFDGSERTEDFMQSRIEHEADYDRMLADTIESVNVF